MGMVVGGDACEEQSGDASGTCWTDYGRKKSRSIARPGRAVMRDGQGAGGSGRVAERDLEALSSGGRNTVQNGGRGAECRGEKYGVESSGARLSPPRLEAKSFFIGQPSGVK